MTTCQSPTVSAWQNKDERSGAEDATPKINGRCADDNIVRAIQTSAPGLSTEGFLKPAFCAEIKKPKKKKEKKGTEIHKREKKKKRIIEHCSMIFQEL